jgi:hypothetical protein
MRVRGGSKEYEGSRNQFYISVFAFSTNVSSSAVGVVAARADK